MTIISCVQRSDVWYAARLGKLTGSRVGDAFATIKKGEAASRRNLKVQLVLERLTGRSQENGYTNADMERGVVLEPEARAAYEAETGIVVQAIGFIQHDDLPTGCSPDGVPHDGLIEIKCPKAATHLDYLRGGLPEEYRLQLIHGLWLTRATWADFVSFHPDFPEPLRLKITRLYSRDVDLAAHELNVRLFLDDVAREEQAVRALAEAVVA